MGNALIQNSFYIWFIGLVVYYYIRHITPAETFKIWLSRTVFLTNFNTYLHGGVISTI